MRRFLIAALLLCLPGLAGAQGFIQYHPPASGMADPGADGFMVRTAAGTSAARTLTSPLGTLAIGNADGVAGNPTLDVDTSIMGQFSTGAGSFGGTCTPGDWYYETDTFFATFCPVTDTGYTVVALPHASGVPTDDNTLVGSGTAWAKKALPDCDDSAGNHLNYDTTTNAWSCGTSSSTSGSGPDVTTVSIVEEFLQGTVTTGAIGEGGWLIGNIGSGASSIAYGTAIANHPGIHRISTSTGDNAGKYMGPGWFVTGDYGSEDWEMSFIFRLPDAVTDSHIQMGFTTGVPLAETSAIGLVYDTDISQGTFIFRVCDSVTSGCLATGDDTNQDSVDSGVTPVQGTWYRFRMRRLTAGVGGSPTIYMSIGHTGAMGTEVTFCASGCDEDLGNMPTASTTLLFAFAARSATAKTCDIDWFSYVETGLVRY